MNHIYRIVFNRSAGVWQVAGEHARGHGKSRGRSRALGALGAMVALAAACATPPAWTQVTIIASGDVLPDNAAGWNAVVDLTVGNTRAGEITVLNGGRLYSAAGGIGTGPGGVGTATVTGSTSSWSVYRDLSIGAGGVGTLNLVDGGSLVVVGGGIVSLAPVAGGTGTINIGAAPGAAPALAGTLAAGEIRFGPGMGTLNFNTSSSTTFRTRLTSGAPGAGVINHYAGTTFLTGDSAGFLGVVNVLGGQLRILDKLGSAEAKIDGGAAAGNTAGVLVAGADAEWTIADNLFVGGTGQGWLTIQNGGLVSNSFGSVNAAQNGAAQVTVSASTWNNTLALLVGADGGGGTVSVQNQGELTSVDGYVGRNTGGDGSVTVRGPGAAWTNSGFLRVGDMGGHGVLSILNGGVVSNTDSYVGSMDGSVGTVEVSGAGAVWNNLGSMTLGYGLGVNAGSLTVADGGVVNVGASGTGAIALAPSAFLFYRPSGTINIGGQAGQAAAGAGAVNASAIQFGAGDATLNFNHTDAGYRFSAALDSGTNSGASHRVNQVAGTTLLAGANGGFKGRTTVSGGKLVVLGSLGGSAEVTGGVLQYGDGATGAANSLAGDLNVTGAGSTLAVQRPARLTVAGDIGLSDGSVLDIAAGATGPSVAADTVTLGNGVAFRLSGISDKTGLDAVLIDTARGIRGDFSAVTVGGFAGEVDYLTVHTGKSADGLQYRATYGLSWTAGNNLAHGAFTLANATDRFDLGVALSDQAANPATGWNGKTLTKAGDGTLVLSGDNRYTGGTVIAGGALEISRDANLGDEAGALTFHGGALAATASFDTPRAITLAQSGRFDVAAGATLGLAGKVAGGGDLIKSGAGTLRLGNAGNAYGNTWIQAGTLVGTAASIRGNVVNEGALVFEQAADGVFQGAISGGGALVKAGSGTLGLSGDSSGFTGSTVIQGGRLATNGRLGGSISIGAGGVLGGSGTVGSGAGSAVTVAAGGILSPGNSIGTLTVDGDLVVEQGARFAVETNPAGSESDLVHVTGNATLNGGVVAHVGASGNYDPRASYTILAADGSLSGRFDSVTSDFAFLTPSLAYDYGARRVSLNLARNERTMASAAATRNQRASAAAIDSLGLASGHAVYDALVQMPDDKALLQSSFDQLSGEIHASARTVLLQDSRYVRDAVGARLGSAANGVGAVSAPVLSAAGNGARLAAPNTRGAAAWLQGMGSWSHVDGDGNAARVSSSTGGFLMGADAPVSDAWRVGLMAGYTRSDFDVRDRASSGDSDNYHLGAYAGGQWGALGLRGGAAYSWHDIATRRSVAMPGFSDRLKAGYDGRTAQVFADLSYRIETPSAAFEPYANLAYVNFRTDGYTESGGAAALHAKGQTSETTYTTLGTRAATRFELGGAQASARGSLGWRHAFGDVRPTATQAYSAGPSFTVAGAPIAKNSAVIEAGLDVQVSGNAAVGLSYQGQLASSAQDHGVRASVSVRF